MISRKVHNPNILEDDLDPVPDSSPLGEGALFDVLTQRYENAAILFIILKLLHALSFKSWTKNSLPSSEYKFICFFTVDLFCLVVMN